MDDVEESAGWEQAVNIDLAFGAEVDLAVSHGGHGETERGAGAVAAGVLLRTVKLMGHVAGVEGVKNGRTARRLVPVFGGGSPDDAIVGAV